MMFSKSAVAVATVLGTSLVGAHLVMVDPVPYNFDSSDNSPLDADGSNFPCKITGDYTVTEENYMVKGETQSMTFHGGTTHGGGSCQISITSDRAPSNSTTWDVIMSIEGGCMDETESDSNIGTSATMVTPFSPNFTIPDSFDAGEYTIAWTWFNRIGSREMYMNCAPITITESSSSKKRSESAAAEKRSSDEFPDLFIANINGCLTEEMYDIRFPNPGDTVEYLGPSSHLIATDADVCYSGSATWGTAGYSTATASSSTQSSSTATTAITTAEASVSTSLTVAVSSQTTEAVQATETAQTTEITPTTTTSVASETSAADTSSGSSSASSSSSEALTGSCSQEGYWNCISGTSFQRCAGGIWTPSQPMPAGTECNAGQSEELAINAVSVTSQTLSEKHLRTHKNGRRGHR